MKFLYQFIIYIVIAGAAVKVVEAVSNSTKPVSEVETVPNGTKSLSEIELNLEAKGVKDVLQSNSTSTIGNNSSAAAIGKSTSPSTEKTTPVPTSIPVVPASKIIPVSVNSDIKKTRGFWNVTSDKNVTCILLKSIIQIDVPYNTTKNLTETAKITVPYNADATGLCADKKNETLEYLQLHWNVNKSVNTLTLRFKSDDKHYFLYSIEMNILSSNSSEFPYISNKTHNFTFVSDKINFLDVPLNMSYTCGEHKIKLSPQIGNTTASLLFTELQVQAFGKKTSKEAHFDEAEDCQPLVTSDIVPIIVGCTLAVLVIVVLIAFVIGRRRSQARGYLSM